MIMMGWGIQRIQVPPKGALTIVSYAVFSFANPVYAAKLYKRITLSFTYPVLKL